MRLPALGRLEASRNCAHHVPQYFLCSQSVLTGAEVSSESFGDKIWAGQQRQQEGSIRPPTAEGSQSVCIQPSPYPHNVLPPIQSYMLQLKYCTNIVN